MNHRTILGLKLAIVSVGFLTLTIACAIGLRFFLGYGYFGLTPHPDREPASVRALTIFEHRGALTSSELGLLGDSLLIRGRKVKVNLEPLSINENQGPRTVVFNLFPDAVLAVDLQTPSVYGVNSGLLVGQVQGDSGSSVRITIQNGVINGTLQTRQKVFRIVDGGSGLHIVTEADKSADK